MKIRDVFFHEIYQLTKSGEDIVVVSSDIGAPSLDDYRRDFSNRFINVGIAEQNLIAVSSGLQLAGKRTIAYGLNPFPITRAFDQVRNIMASLQIPITLTALNAGTCSADAGYTHMPIENIAIMRTLKNICVISPSDEIITRKLVKEIINAPFPRYIQFDKFIEGCLYSENDICFEKGFVTNQRSSAIAVVANGIMAHELIKRKLPVKIIDCFSLPISEDKFIEEVQECKQIITVEDGGIDGGIGSMVLEVLNRVQVNIPVRRLGLKFKEGYPDKYTNRGMIFKEEKLSITDIEQCIMGMMGEGKDEPGI